MINFIKKNYYYFIFFIFIFLLYSYIAYPLLYADPTANYAFSYAIVQGEIPYLDFNIISTPLYSYLLSVGLLIWNNFSMILLEQALLVTIMFYLLNKIFDKKGFILLITVNFVGFFCINPTYNYMAVFMLVLILLFEKKYSDKDYLIGILIGLAILSKHTIGAFFILPSIIYYFKDKKKLLRRFIGLLCVGIIFILFLLITGSFMQFLDLCIFGLFDFSSNNSHPTTIYFYLSILIFLISLIITIKNKNDITNYYLLFTYAFVVPIFDLHHFSYYIFCFSMQLLQFIKKYETYLSKLSLLLFVIISTLFGINVRSIETPVLNKKINHYQYIFNGVKNYDNNISIFKMFDKYEDALIISYYKMLYDITRDKKIDYFDVPLYGNAGYNGSEKMISRIKKMHNKYIIVDMFCYDEKNKDSQFDKKIAKYVIDNYKKIEDNGKFAVYYKE